MPKAKANTLSLLGRFFKRKPTSTLAAELNSRAINRPLFAHAELGAQIIQGFLMGQGNQFDEKSADSLSVTVGETAVLDISGALVSRPTGWCSPLSYEEIRDEFEQLNADTNVSAIVLRMDTAGGEASQNIDLSDYIFNARGTKPIIAMVDDMAYSAGYAIASACDEIWVTRTSGVGSVGVVSYHVDQSEHNKQKGIKIEFIHAGARKVDFNPHNPLADEARDRMQGEVDRLYSLFTETIARNRGMELQAVIDTQASTYHGEQAIAVGLADTLGTFADLLVYLDTGEKPVQPPIQITEAKPTEIESPKQGEAEQEESVQEGTEQNEQQGGQGATQESSETEAAEATKAMEAIESTETTEPSQAEANQTESDSAADLTLAQQAEIKAVCTAAGIASIAQDYITAGTKPNQVREDLITMLTTGDIEVSSSHKAATVSASGTATAQPQTASKVYARRNQKRGK